MAQALQDLSKAMADAVEAAGKSIVRVEGRRRMPASGIVWSADGVIVTAHHVVEHDEVTIGLPDGEEVAATLAGRDPTTDLAVLRAKTKGLSAPKWAAPADLKVGHLVLAAGRPGKTVQATLGVISALGDTWRTPAGGEIDRYLQTDVVMYPGFSGGPLIGAGGELAGLNTSALLRGVSVTIPAPTISRIVEMLLAHGRVRRGFLGVGAQPVRLPGGLRDTLNQETGLLIASVETDSPAEKGGLLLGDTIVGLDGQPVRHLDDLLALLSSDRIGKAVSIQIVRGGQVQDVKATIGEKE
jgi:S1-C subfamily serine protease